MRLSEVLTENFEWSSDADKDVYMSLKGLANKNNGVFKSRAQQGYVLNRIVKAEPDRTSQFVLDNFGLRLGDGEKIVTVDALTRWADYGSRSLIPVRFGLIVDPIGVVKIVKFGNKGNLRDGSSIDISKNKITFERPAKVNAKHLEKTEDEKKKEFKTALGMSDGNYIGEVGERMNFGALELVRKKQLDDSQFGYNMAAARFWNMYKNDNGDFVYHTGKEGPEPGGKINVVGRVKKHLVNKQGDKVTVVSRPHFKAIT